MSRIEYNYNFYDFSFQLEILRKLQFFAILVIFVKFVAPVVPIFTNSRFQLANT